MEVIVKISNQGSWTTTPFVTIADFTGYNSTGAYIGVQGGTINFSPAGENFQSEPFSNDTWYVITTVYSNNTAALYVNGVWQGSLDNANNDNHMGSNLIKPLYLGNPPTNSSTTVQQIKISRFKYYTRALSVSEIGSNFSMQKAVYGL